MKRVWKIIGALMLFASTGYSLVSAGGWATVRLEEPLIGLVAGEAQTVELSVWAHDRSLTEVESVTIVATNTDTGDSLSFPAASTGTTGEYETELVLPSAGTWKFIVEIPPYPEFALPTADVASVRSEPDLAGRMNLAIGRGDCLHEPEIVSQFVLSPTASNPQLFGGAASGFAVDSVLMLLGPDGDVRACGGLPATGSSSLVVVTLEATGESEDAAVVSLTGTGAARSVRALSISKTEGSEVATVEIAENMSNEWTFSPSTIDITPGDVVVWINDTGVAHTIASNSPDFRDSSLIEPFAMFSQILQREGSYEYVCGPHQWMTGSIVVAG